jgi:hypothetical protein
MLGGVGAGEGNLPGYPIETVEKPQIAQIYAKKSPLFSIGLFSEADFFDSLVSQH